jgi:hypothetical protein
VSRKLALDPHELNRLKKSFVEDIIDTKTITKNYERKMDKR